MSQPVSTNGHHRRNSSVSEALKATVKTVAAAARIATGKEGSNARRWQLIRKNAVITLVVLGACFVLVGLFYRLVIYRYPQDPVFPLVGYFGPSSYVTPCEEIPNGAWTSKDVDSFQAIRRRCLAKLEMVAETNKQKYTPVLAAVPAVYFGVPVMYSCFLSDTGSVMELVNPRMVGPGRAGQSISVTSVLCGDDAQLAPIPTTHARDPIVVEAHEPGTANVNGCGWKRVQRIWSGHDATMIRYLVSVMNGHWPCACNDPTKDFDTPAKRMLVV